MTGVARIRIGDTDEGSIPEHGCSFLYDTNKPRWHVELFNGLQEVITGAKHPAMACDRHGGANRELLRFQLYCWWSFSDIYAHERAETTFRAVERKNRVKCQIDLGSLERLIQPIFRQRTDK